MTRGVDEGRLIEIDGVSKRFGGVTALHDVSVDIRCGEIHGFAGENGAGKSTLGRLIAGAIRPEHGELRVDGEKRLYASPRDAIADGITLIAQDPMLVPGRSVAENVFLGHEPRSRGIVKIRELAKLFRDLCDRTGFDLDPAQPVGSLRVAEQQKVEILRALSRDARVIVMDEPTARLTFAESEVLYTIARDLRAAGITLIYISHFLVELLDLCDRVTVLKDGRHVKTAAASAETQASLVTSMLGRRLELAFPTLTEPASAVTPALQVTGITRRGVFSNVSFTVAPGEIVGMAGLVGSGRTEIARAVFGADRLDGGEVMVEGRKVRLRSPADAIRNGIAMLPENRREEGLVLGRGVRENLTLASLSRWSRLGFLQLRRERRDAREIIARLTIKTPSQRTPVSALSGGNQQKALFGKWLTSAPKVMVVDEPTCGVDVGAKFAIYELIARMAAEGTAVLLISSELEEIRGLSHRILVVRAGRIVTEFAPDVSEHDLLSAAFGNTDFNGSHS